MTAKRGRGAASSSASRRKRAVPREATDVSPSPPSSRSPLSSRSVRRSWNAREVVATPRSSFEELEIRTSDGAALRAVVDDPPEKTPLRGTLVLAHAMFARKASFGRRGTPGLSSELVARGFRTIAFDFRGHGDSALPVGGGDWGYDDLVRHDLPAVLECARARASDKPLVVLGHSLGGHAAIAAQATGHLSADAIVAIGANVWLRELERSRVRWGVKVAIARAALALSPHVGRFPGRRLGFGSDDAGDRYLRELSWAAAGGEWRSADGQDDYWQALRRVTVPVAAVLGERDVLLCHPSAGAAFARRCGGPVATFRAPAGHMDLVTNREAWPVIVDAVEWAAARARS